MERPQKILVTMLELSAGSTKSLKYEDIVVGAFERFPDEFALRGYPQYPDSSDIHKPLYGPLKRQGLVRSGNKTFALTARGVEEARKLSPKSAGGGTGDRLTRDMQVEIDRMVSCEAYHLYVRGSRGRVLDTDFYAFLGCSVRTGRNDFLGRIQVCGEAIEKGQQLGKPSPEEAQQLAGLWAFLREKFAAEIKRREGSR
jgi:hypothetical protein